MSDAGWDEAAWADHPGVNGEGATPPTYPPDEPDVRWARQVEYPDALDWVPVLRAPKDGSPLRGVSINECFTGAWVHWLDGRTVPCRRERRRCNACLAGCLSRLVGYILVARTDLLPAIFEVPAGLMRSRPGLADPSAGLRGRLLNLKRHPRGRNGYVSLEVSEKPARLALGAELPPDQDIRPILLRLWEAG